MSYVQSYTQHMKSYAILVQRPCPYIRCILYYIINKKTINFQTTAQQCEWTGGSFAKREPWGITAAHIADMLCRIQLVTPICSPFDSSSSFRPAGTPWICAYVCVWRNGYKAYMWYCGSHCSPVFITPLVLSFTLNDPSICCIAFFFLSNSMKISVCFHDCSKHGTSPLYRRFMIHDGSYTNGSLAGLLG